VLPNFLIIGAARCGTTTLYSYLAEHPQIFLPASKRPEPHFFYREDEYAKGLQWYQKRYFSAWSGQTAVGEASTSYIFGPEVAQRLKENLPDVKLIALLRNPMDRAFSNYWASRQNGLETLSFDDAIKREEERSRDPKMKHIMPFAYIARSRYDEQLQRFLAVFGAKQVRVHLFEDMLRNPARVLRDLLEFLEVYPQHRFSRLDRLENAAVPEDEGLNFDTRRHLYSVLQPSIDNLEKLLGRDLTLWRPS
jgi:hypothetical protein